MSALDELKKKEITTDAEECIIWASLTDTVKESAITELTALRSDLEDAKARAKTAEENWHKNEARVSKLHESIKAAQIELHATQRNWDEECLFECNDILTAALKGAE